MRTLEGFAVILAVAGGISTLAAAGNWVVQIIGAVKAPNEEQNRRLTQLERHMKEVKNVTAN